MLMSSSLNIPSTSSISRLTHTLTHFKICSYFQKLTFTNSKFAALQAIMTTLSLHSPSISLLDLQVPKNIKSSSKNGSVVSMTPMARTQFQPQRRPNLGTTYRTPGYSWMATVGEKVQSHTVPTSVPVRVALELLQAGHRFLDVRTPDEFSAGHADGAINIPYMFRIGSGMTKNPNFLEEVMEHFGKDDEIIVGCQSGKRSLMAATDLLAVGFSGVTDIAGGYAAWTDNRLPTHY